MQQLTEIKRVRLSKYSCKLLSKLHNESKFIREAIQEKLQRDYAGLIEKMNTKKERKLPF